MGEMVYHGLYGLKNFWLWHNCNGFSRGHHGSNVVFFMFVIGRKSFSWMAKAKWFVMGSLGEMVCHAWNGEMVCHRWLG